MTKDPLCTIIIPSFDNFEYLSGALTSLIANQTTSGLMRIIVVNNGHPNSCDWINHSQVSVIQTGGKNLGWEGGIKRGLEETASPFVCFFNDDAYVPTSSRLWLNRLLQYFKDPKVGAVGPSSNVVMGMQNIFVNVPVHVFETKFLIGFCVLIRREAFEAIGGMDMDLPSGDDLDWSIRLREAGYKLLVDREVFIYHHGFKTGTRTMGDHRTSGGWNSYEMQERTNHALIKKHGLKKWFETVRGASQMPEVSYTDVEHDIEGKEIKKFVSDKDQVILDLGCADNKTIKRAIGVDFIPKGEHIPTLEFNREVVSQADIQADVSKELPVEDKSADVIIARHILEHMIDPLEAIGFWLKKLKKGGKLIIAVPNQEMHSTIPMNSEHVHAYTPTSLTGLLGAFNMKVLDVFPSKNQISFITVAQRQ